MLTSQTTVASDHVIPDKTVTAPVAIVASEPMSKPKQQQQPKKTLMKQSLKAVDQSLSLNEQHNHKPLVVAKQPPTKPLPLLGMECRAHMMAERRQARMERQRQREEQILVSQCIHTSKVCVFMEVPYDVFFDRGNK